MSFNEFSEQVIAVNNYLACLSQETGILLHEKGLILEVNQVLAQILGYKISELVGTNIIRLLAPAYRILVANNIASGYEQPYQALFLRKNGLIWVAECHNKVILYQGKKIRIAAVRSLRY